MHSDTKNYNSLSFVGTLERCSCGGAVKMEEINIIKTIYIIRCPDCNILLKSFGRANAMVRWNKQMRKEKGKISEFV